MTGGISIETRPVQGKLDRQKNFLPTVTFVTCLLTPRYKAFSEHRMIKKFHVITSKGTYIYAF